jgi:hypothetical protein
MLSGFFQVWFPEAWRTKNTTSPTVMRKATLQSSAIFSSEGGLLRDQHSVRTKLPRAANQEGTKIYFYKLANVNFTTSSEAVT